MESVPHCFNDFLRPLEQGKKQLHGPQYREHQRHVSSRIKKATKWKDANLIPCIVVPSVACHSTTINKLIESKLHSADKFIEDGCSSMGKAIVDPQDNLF